MYKYMNEANNTNLFQKNKYTIMIPLSLTPEARLIINLLVHRPGRGYQKMTNNEDLTDFTIYSINP